MNSTGAIHPAILVVLAALLLALSATIVFLRRKRTMRSWRSLTAFGQTFRSGVGRRPKLAAFCRAMGQRRWQLVCLLLIAIAGATWLLSRDTTAETEVAVVGVIAMDDTGADAFAEGSIEVEIDSRQLARQDADARRIQQGLILLAAIGVIALLWAAASRFAAAR
jgi:LPXTG-motif cell wall-anchored protein